MTKHEAFIEKNWRDHGLAHLLVARIREGNVEFAVFVADLWCLGIKDAIHIEDATQSEYEDLLAHHIPDDLRERIHPACARKLVESALAYGESLGFAPHRDFRKARRVFNGIQSADCPETFATGKNGRPCYVEGPDEPAGRTEKVLAILDAKFGPDGYDFVSEDPEFETDSDMEEAANDLWYEFLEKTPAPSCANHAQLRGMLVALHVTPKIVSPLNHLRLFIHDAHPAWADENELAEMTAGLHALWNNSSALIEDTDEDRETGFVISVHEFDEEKPLEYNFAQWCLGFVRTLELWPDAWVDAPQRPALRPHFELLRAWADAAREPDKAAYPKTDAPEDNITDAVMALFHALEPDRRPGPDSPPV